MRRKPQARDCASLPSTSNVNGMGKRQPPRVAMTFRLSPEAAKRIKSFLADYAGKPLFLKPGPWAEEALLREVQRLELVLAGALPASPAPDEAGDPVAERKAVLDHTLNNQPRPVAPGGCTVR